MILQDCNLKHSMYMLMEEILHQLRLVVYPIIYKVFSHPRWLCGIPSINRMVGVFGYKTGVVSWEPKGVPLGSHDTKLGS